MYKRNYKSWTKHADFIIFDLLTLFISILIAYFIYNQSFSLFKAESYRDLTIFILLLDAFELIVFNVLHNVVKRGYYAEFSKTLKHVIALYASLFVVLFALKFSATYSRLTLFLSAIIYLILSYTVRILWKKFIIKRINTNTVKNMVLICSRINVQRFVNRSHNIALNNVVGVIITDENAEGDVVCELPVVANLENAADYICREWVDEVFFFPQSMNELETGDEISDEVAVLLEQCRQMAIPIHIRIPLGKLGSKSFVERVNGFNVITYTTNYSSPLQHLIKRLMDIIGGIVGSIVALLIMLVVGPIIKIKSPGPILFSQERIGLNGKRFKIYKIRSMYMDAEERKKELMAQNRVSDGMMFKMDFDPRIIGNRIENGKQKTGIGEFIRKTSLDEFPQFFNVLIGNMSLVGTRPPTVDEWEKYKYHHRARLSVKPGITGMWQVSGRSSITDFEEVVKLDTEYIENWGIGLDLRILFKTVKTVLKKDGAM